MVRTSPFHGGNMGSSPVGITIKKSALMALFLMVVRSGVIIASQIDLSEAMITQQVTDAQLLSVLLKHAKLLS